MAIRWVFLDVGNVLLDEDLLTYLVFHRHWEAVHRVRPSTSFLEFLGDRERRASAGARWPLFEAASEVLDESACAEVWGRVDLEVRARFSELSPLILGADRLVRGLSGRYRLGLIANQGAECRVRLAEVGLLEFFDVVILSEEQGASKPSPALFLAALDRAGALPHECLMVGDRLENDIEPASALGFATAWVRWPRREAKGWRPDDPDSLAWRDSLERTALRSPGLFPGARPSIVIDQIGDLARTIAEMGAAG